MDFTIADMWITLAGFLSQGCFYHKPVGSNFRPDSHGLALIEISLEDELGENCIVKKWEVK